VLRWGYFDYHVCSDEQCAAPNTLVMGTALEIRE